MKKPVLPDRDSESVAAAEEITCTDYLTPVAPWQGGLLTWGSLLVFMAFSTAVADATYSWPLLLLLYLNPLAWRFIGPVVVLPFVAIHELCHVAVFRLGGASPRIEPFIYNGKKRGWSVVAPGVWFTRGLYLSAMIAPTIVVNLLGFVLLSLPLPSLLRGVLVVALSFHMRGCFSDWRAVRTVLTLPRTARIQDLDHGFAYRIG